MRKQRVPQRKVAVFDIDGTIFRSSLLIETVEALIDEGIFPKKARARYVDLKRQWLNRKNSYNAYLAGVILAFDTHIVGVRERDLVRIVKKVVMREKDKVYRYTRDLVLDLKRKGFFLLAISHSPRDMVYVFAKQMGFDKVYGRSYYVAENGRFTGVVRDLAIINDKSKILKRAIQKEHLKLSGSFGVGDSEGDIKFLNLVSYPICFNPSGGLLKVAIRKKWKVVVERKNVIYTLSPGSWKAAERDL